MNRVGIFLLLAIIAVFLGTSKAQQQPPELFSYAELTQLYETPNLPEALQVKLDRLLTTPFISNSASGRVPRLPRTRHRKLHEPRRVEWCCSDIAR